jgi:glycosyltransferase involved in cell wall biosynthesis
MNKLPSLSFFFPAHQEEGNIEALVRQAQQILPTVADTWEIIPVDDGSTDRTGEIADRLAAEDSHVHPVHHRHNLGYGAALASGFTAARYEFIFFTDGDRQFDLNEIALLTAHAQEADLVIGYRRMRRDHFVRKLNQFLWGHLVRALFNFRARDVNCAFKLLRRSVLVPLRFATSGAMISTELLVRAQRAGFRCVEVGVTHLSRTQGTASGAKLTVIAKAFTELAVLYWKLRREDSLGARG